MIKTFDFINRISDIYFLADSTTHVLSNKEAKEIIIGRSMEGFGDNLDSYFAQGVITPINTEYDKEKLKKSIVGEMEKSYKDKIDRNILILLNQDLVMLCTIMEIFLSHIVEEIIEKQPTLISYLCPDRRISIKKIAEHNVSNKIDQLLKSEALRTFSFAFMADKLKMLTKLNIDVDKMFRLLTKDGDDKSAKNRELFMNIYEKRNDIIHRNLLPISSKEELIEAKRLFELIVFNLSIMVMKEHKILMDIQDMLINNGEMAKPNWA